MKQKSIILFLTFSMIGVLLTLSSCKKDIGKAKVKFEGFVYDSKGNALPSTIISVNASKVKSDDKGRFALAVDSAAVFVLKANRENFASFSKVFGSSTKDIRITLFEATVASFDPRKPIVLTDIKSRERPGPTSSRAAWTSFAEVPLVYENSKVVDFGFSPKLKAAFEYVRSRKQAGPGISISIPANGLVRQGTSQQPTSNVNVSLSTIDLFTGGAMPGDFSVVNARGERDGFMISMGAGSVEIYDEKGSYQLSNEAKATITIPIDTSALIFRSNIPESIPLFYYNEETGYWTEDGKANINETKTAYVAELRHFSTFNMDFKISDPSCVQIRHNSVNTSTLPIYKVEAILDFGGSIVQTERTISDPGPNSGTWPSIDPAPCLQNANSTSVHMLFNLPQNTEVCLIFYQPGTPDIPVSIAVVNTGATYGSAVPTCPAVNCPNDIDCPSACNDASCGGYGTCSLVPFSRITTEVLLARRKSGTNLQLKWIHNTSTVGSISYQVFEVDDVGNPLTAISTLSGSVPLNPKNYLVLSPSAGQHFYGIFVGGTLISNVVDETF